MDVGIVRWKGSIPMRFEPRDDMPPVEGPGGPPISVMRAAAIGPCRFSLLYFRQYANCSEVVMRCQMLEPTPSTFLSHTLMVPSISGYRFWPTTGQGDQHTETTHYIVSPRLPDAGMADLAVHVQAHGTGHNALFERSNLTMIDVPRLEFEL